VSRHRRMTVRLSTNGKESVGGAKGAATGRPPGGLRRKAIPFAPTPGRRYVPPP
jgi:hypothetical protein